MSISLKNTHPLLQIFPISTQDTELTKPNYVHQMGNFSFQKARNFSSCKPRIDPLLSQQISAVHHATEPRKFKWFKIDHCEMTQSQKEAISQLPLKMSNRCKALMGHIICSSYQSQSVCLSDLLGSWVRIMNPRRTDWLSVLKQLNVMDHPLYAEVAELALLEESFEANARDYTKVIHHYGKQTRVRDAENTLLALNERGFVADQVTLTTMIHVYSKAGNLKKAEETFKELKLLHHPLDRRAYDSMIMAYVRAGIPGKGEALLREMDAEEIYAGPEVYKALLRAYSMVGESDGAQRVFDAFQFAGIPPDVRACGLLINAYVTAGESRKAHAAFENMRRAGLEPSDKCIALVLAAFEKENKLDEALNFLMSLESDGIMIGTEASEKLAGWFRRLGVVKEVELVLREYAGEEISCEIPA